jgi:hypothetical protein
MRESDGSNYVLVRLALLSTILHSFEAATRSSSSILSLQARGGQAIIWPGATRATRALGSTDVVITADVMYMPGWRRAALIG